MYFKNFHNKMLKKNPTNRKVAVVWNSRIRIELGGVRSPLTDTLTVKMLYTLHFFLGGEQDNDLFMYLW